MALSMKKKRLTTIIFVHVIGAVWFAVAHPGAGDTVTIRRTQKLVLATSEQSD